MPRMDQTPRSGRPTPKRVLGLWMATALVTGNMIGSGVFLLPATLAKTVGPVAILSWVLTGMGALLLALVFSNLSSIFPRIGGPYAYARHAFGDFIGFQTAWGYWIQIWAGNAAVALAFTGYLSVFWPALSHSRLLAALAGLAAIWGLTCVNILGVRQGGLIQLITTVLKFVPLAAIGILGPFLIDPAHFTPFAPHGFWEGLNAGAALTLWAFVGLESASVPADEVIDPERTIPWATLIGTIAATGVYFLTAVAILGIVPAERLAQSASPFADAAAILFEGEAQGLWAMRAVACVALISTFGCLNGRILLQGRVPLAAARDGLFPAQFTRLHPSRQTPVFGLIVSSLLASGLLLMNYTQSLVEQFRFVILLATLSILIPYLYTAAAEAHLFLAERERFRGRSLARNLSVTALAFSYAVYAISGAGAEIVAKGFLLLLAGIPVYVFLKWQDPKNRRRS